VGWYLMVPSPVRDGAPDIDAPLSQWNIHTSFDSAKECEQAADGLRAKMIGPLGAKLAKGKPLRLRPDELKGLEWSQAIHCIATDDPRLQGKLGHP
jgi:hypothetical protein